VTVGKHPGVISNIEDRAATVGRRRVGWEVSARALFESPATTARAPIAPASRRALLVSTHEQGITAGGDSVASSSRAAPGSGRVKTGMMWPSSADADPLWSLQARRLVWRGGLLRNSGLSLLEHVPQTR
jgi:hypothetical protein